MEVKELTTLAEMPVVRARGPGVMLILMLRPVEVNNTSILDVSLVGTFQLYKLARPPVNGRTVPVVLVMLTVKFAARGSKTATMGVDVESAM